MAQSSRQAGKRHDDVGRVATRSVPSLISRDGDELCELASRMRVATRARPERGAEVEQGDVRLRVLLVEDGDRLT